MCALVLDLPAHQDGARRPSRVRQPADPVHPDHPAAARREGQEVQEPALASLLRLGALASPMPARFKMIQNHVGLLSGIGESVRAGDFTLLHICPFSPAVPAGRPIALILGRITHKFAGLVSPLLWSRGPGSSRLRVRAQIDAASWPGPAQSCRLRDWASAGLGARHIHVRSSTDTTLQVFCGESRHRVCSNTRCANAFQPERGKFTEDRRGMPRWPTVCVHSAESRLGLKRQRQ